MLELSTMTGTVMCTIIFVGSVGNLLTLFVIIRYRPLHDVTGMFIANLAVADLLQSTFGMPLIATSAFHNRWRFGDSLCTLSGMTNSLFCITSMLTLAAISLDRCLAIVFPLNHFSLISSRRARLALVYIWAHALLVAVLPVFGWSRYVYLSYEFICTVQWEYNKSYTIFLSVTSFALPLIVTVLSYASVMKVACHQAHETPPLKVGCIEQELATHVGVNGDSFAVDANELKRKKSPKLEKAGAQENSTNDMELLPTGKFILSVLGRRKSSNDPFHASRMSVKYQYPDQTYSKVQNPKLCYANLDSSLDGQLLPVELQLTVQRSSQVNPEPSSLGAEVFPEDPELNRRSQTGTIPEVGDEVNFRRDGLELVSSPNNTRPRRPLSRAREWMNVKRTNKEVTDAVLHRKKEMKVVLTLAVVNGTFILCWLPHFIGIMCLMFTKGSCPFSDSFFMITTTLAMLNSGCNPFIYTLTYRKFRKAFKKTLPWFWTNRIRNG